MLLLLAIVGSFASADGDGRFLLNQAETLYNAGLTEPLDPAGLGSFLQRRVAVYDKDRDGHYNLISALHKAVRGSDPDAALYYLARMLTAGEEPADDRKVAQSRYPFHYLAFIVSN